MMSTSTKQFRNKLHFYSIKTVRETAQALTPNQLVTDFPQDSIDINFCTLPDIQNSYIVYKYAHLSERTVMAS